MKKLIWPNINISFFGMAVCLDESGLYTRKKNDCSHAVKTAQHCLVYCQHFSVISHMRREQTFKRRLWVEQRKKNPATETNRKRSVVAIVLGSSFKKNDQLFSVVKFVSCFSMKTPYPITCKKCKIHLLWYNQLFKVKRQSCDKFSVYSCT